METNLVKEMDATKGMEYVTSMIKLNYIGELLSENKKCKPSRMINLVSAGIRNSPMNGKPYYFSNTDVDNMQSVVQRIGIELMKTEITSEVQTAEQYPLCYGETFVEKFKVLRKVIVLPYLFKEIMGRTTRWQKMHLSDKAERYYNTFTADELEEINDAIRSLALRLCSIKLTYLEDTTV